MKPRTSLSLGALTAIVIGVLVALTGANAFAADQDRFDVGISGQGETVIYIPGLTSSSGVFEPFANARADTEGHLITLAGFAGLPAPEPLDAFTRPAADSLIAYIEAEDLDGIRLVGHSMGGVIALMIAAELPERIESVLIVDSVPFFAGLRNPAADPAEIASGRDAVRERFLNMGHEAYLGIMRQGLPIQATSAESQAIVWSDIEASDQNAVAIALSEVMHGDFRSLLPGIAAHVTVLVSHNNFVPVSRDDLLAAYASQYEGLDRLEVRLIDNSRHFIMLDQPEVFATELNRFLGEPAQ